MCDLARATSQRDMSHASTIIWSLITLRYRLLWAQARTARGRTALFIALYVMGGVLFLFLNLGGVGAAVAAAKSGHGEEIARWVLTAMSASGIAAGLVLGAGPRMAFAVPALRRYPMSPRCLLAARHVVGFLDPMWSFLSAVAIGLAGGFALMGLQTIVAGLPATILCVAASYLVTLILFTLIDCILSRNGGATTLGAAVFILSATACLAGPFLVTSGDSSLWRVVDEALVFTPPGCAASVLAGGKTLSGVLGLIAWCMALALALAMLEQRKHAMAAASPRMIIGERFYDRVECLFGEQSGPLVGKALRYHLRSNRARFNLAMSIPMMVFLPRLMGKNSSPDATFLLTLALFFCGGILATSSVTLNQFGYEGAGIRRYCILPVPFVHALQMSSMASLLMGGAAIMPGLVLWALTAGPDLDARRALMLISSGIAGLFFFNAVGIWTTVLEPRSLDFRSVIGNHLSASGNLAVFGGVSVTLGAVFLLTGSNRGGTVFEYWWLLPLSAVCCSGIYLISLRLVTGLLKRRCEGLVETLAGQSFH